MGNDHVDPLQVTLRGDPGLVQHGRLSIRNQAPVFHRTGGEIRDRDHVCAKYSERITEPTVA